MAGMPVGHMEPDASALLEHSEAGLLSFPVPLNAVWELIRERIILFVDCGKREKVGHQPEPLVLGISFFRRRPFAELKVSIHKSYTRNASVPRRATSLELL